LRNFKQGEISFDEINKIENLKQEYNILQFKKDQFIQELGLEKFNQYIEILKKQILK
jgi:hypothetical protein